MRRSHRTSWPLAAAMILAIVRVASAQPQAPQTGYVCPAGGARGHTFMAVVGGQYFDGVTGARFTGEGITAKVVEHTKPLTRKQTAALQSTLASLQRVNQTADVVDEIAAIRKRLAARKPSNPGLSESVTLEVTIAPGAAAGPRELRLLSPGGVSNPLVFQVGVLTEFAKEWPKISDRVEVLRLIDVVEAPPDPAAAGPMKLTLPAVVNGQVQPQSVERFRFDARRGQKIVVAAEVRKLIPYIADAVPGWFQAAIAIYDPNGRELQYADHFRYHPDPVLCCDIPRDGEYTLEIRDSIYRGREDFVFRITIGELPYITGIFPLGCKAGSQATVELTGWNLPARQVKQDARDLSVGVHSLAGAAKDWPCNRVAFAVDDLPEVLAAGGNDSPARAQAVTLPVIVNGRIDAPARWDVYRFEARSGDEVVAEVTARRLGSPLDSVLMLTDANGVQLALNDDHEDKAAGLDTHHADSYIRAKLPAAGTYYVHVGDIQRQGGPEYAYRLRLSAPRPDYELRVTPSSINVRGNENVPVTLWALRKDGFAGEIAISLKDAPAGFALSGGTLPAGQDRVRLTLTAPSKAPAEPFVLRVQGRAVIGGGEVARAAVPAQDMMQAFAYRHLVPSQELAVVVPGNSPGAALRLAADACVKIPAGGRAGVLVAVAASGAGERIEFELREPPDGVTVQSASPAGAATEMVLCCDANKIKPGYRGTLLVTAVAVIPPDPAMAAPEPSPSGSPRPRRPRFNPDDLPAMPNMNPEGIQDGMMSDIDFDDSLQAAMMASAAEQARKRPLPSASPAAATTAATSPSASTAPAPVAGPPRRQPIGLLPAIPFEIIPP